MIPEGEGSEHAVELGEWRPRVHDGVADELQKAVVRARRDLADATSYAEHMEETLKKQHALVSDLDQKYTALVRFLQDVGVKVPSGSVKDEQAPILDLK